MTIAIVTYYPRNPYASPRVSFGFPDGNITLEKEVSQSVESDTVEWLKENSEEFKLACEQNIIVSTVVATPPVTPTPTQTPTLDAGAISPKAVK